MGRKEMLLSKALGNTELCLIEDALKLYSEAEPPTTEYGKRVLAELQETVSVARQYCKLYSKTDDRG